jgi:tRNA (guanine37-N1)-methyltransferase
LIACEAVDIRDYAENRHRKVDDYPFGGGAGMVMAAPPIVRCFEDIVQRISGAPRVLYMTPQGRVFSQQIARELAAEHDIVMLCGRYEGIDERALEMIHAEPLSIGDYVLSGGELPALVVMDAVSRLIPGVLGNALSPETESFSALDGSTEHVLEYPQYTRPEEYCGYTVPEVLLSGHHANIEKWRGEQSALRTAQRRPDLVRDSDH